MDLVLSRNVLMLAAANKNGWQARADTEKCFFELKSKSRNERLWKRCRDYFGYLTQREEAREAIDNRFAELLREDSTVWNHLSDISGEIIDICVRAAGLNRSSSRKPIILQHTGNLNSLGDLADDLSILCLRLADDRVEDDDNRFDRLCLEIERYIHENFQARQVMRALA